MNRILTKKIWNILIINLDLSFNNKLGSKSGKTVVEKHTNCLRLNFVSKIIPNAKYIYIKRNIDDVIPSATKRWNASLDLKYIIAKSYFILNLSYLIMLQDILNRLRKFYSKDTLKPGVLDLKE